MLVYGIGADFSQYEMREILGWLLLVGLLHLIVGNFVWKRRVCHAYMSLIRQGRFSKWWHGLCLRVLGLCFAATLLAFAVVWLLSFIVGGRMGQEAVGITVLKAFFLFYLNTCFFGTIQMLLVNLGQWEKLSFLAVMVAEVLSLYGKALGKGAAYWLPGSWKMYIRSSWALEEGYSPAMAIGIQILWILVCAWMGYKLLDRRR